MGKTKVDLKTTQDINNPNITKCPYCGCEEYYTKIRITGETIYRYRFDGNATDNGEMYDGLTDTIIGKFAYCSDCNRRIFRIED